MPRNTNNIVVRMPVTKILLRCNGRLITWDGLSEKRISSLIAQLNRMFNIGNEYILSTTHLTHDGDIGLPRYYRDRYFNKTVPLLTIDAKSYTADFVSADVARTIYKEFGFYQNIYSKGNIHAKYITTIPITDIEVALLPPPSPNLLYNHTKKTLRFHLNIYNPYVHDYTPLSILREYLGIETARAITIDDTDKNLLRRVNIDIFNRLNGLVLRHMNTDIGDTEADAYYLYWVDEPL